MPHDSWRARVCWSIPATLIVAMWTIGVLGAAVTGFIEPYTFAEVLAEIARGGADMFWPGEYGLDSSLILKSVQLTPLLALVGWLLCLVRWRTHRQRLTAMIAALLIPAWLVPFVLWNIAVDTARYGWDDHIPIIEPFLFSIFGTAHGEDWQEGSLVLPAMFFWWVLLSILIVLTVKRWRRQCDDGCCAKCGYSTFGLTSNICPECGSKVTGPLQITRRG